MRRVKVVRDYLKDLYNNLSKVAGMSPRLVRNYHEQHVERCWCGNWINNFLTDFVTGGDRDRDKALNSLINHHLYMMNINDTDFFNEIRAKARTRLGRPRRPLVTRTRG